MKFKDEKVVGYILLAIGVVMIFFSVFLMFNVFTGASAPPKLFNFSDISFSIPQPGGIPETVQISGQDISRIVAMGFWYLLMFFIMLAGGRIASLGVNLIREIRVEVKQ